MRPVSKVARILYIIVAFTASWLTSPIGPSVLAQSHQPKQGTDEGQMIISQQSDAAKRLGALEVRVNEISDSVSNMRGIGSGALGVLGVLQIVGMVGGKKKDD